MLTEGFSALEMYLLLLLLLSNPVIFVNRVLFALMFLPSEVFYPWGQILVFVSHKGTVRKSKSA